MHWRKKRGDQLKTWMTTLKEDLARLSGPAVYGLRRWNQDWMTIGIAELGQQQFGTRLLSLMPTQSLPGECRPK